MKSLASMVKEKCIITLELDMTQTINKNGVLRYVSYDESTEVAQKEIICDCVDLSKKYRLAVAIGDASEYHHHIEILFD